MRDLQWYVNDCIRELEEYGIENAHELLKWRYVVNKRAILRFGQCRYGYKEINISEFLLDEKITFDENQLRDTIIHEMLHALTPKSGHKGKWITLANKVNRASKGKYNIKRCGDYDGIHEDELDKKNKPKYIIKCKKCGTTWNHYRMCPSVKHPERFRCGCGGDIKLVS